MYRSTSSYPVAVPPRHSVSDTQSVASEAEPRPDDNALPPTIVRFPESWIVGGLPATLPFVTGANRAAVIFALSRLTQCTGDEHVVAAHGCLYPRYESPDLDMIVVGSGCDAQWVHDVVANLRADSCVVRAKSNGFSDQHNTGAICHSIWCHLKGGVFLDVTVVCRDDLNALSTLHQLIRQRSLHPLKSLFATMNANESGQLIWGELSTFDPHDALTVDESGVVSQIALPDFSKNHPVLCAINRRQMLKRIKMAFDVYLLVQTINAAGSIDTVRIGDWLMQWVRSALSEQTLDNNLSAALDQNDFSSASPTRTVVISAGDDIPMDDTRIATFQRAVGILLWHCATRTVGGLDDDTRSRFCVVKWAGLVTTAVVVNYLRQNRELEELRDSGVAGALALLTIETIHSSRFTAVCELLHKDLLACELANDIAGWLSLYNRITGARADRSHLVLPSASSAEYIATVSTASAPVLRAIVAPKISIPDNLAVLFCVDSGTVCDPAELYPTCRMIAKGLVERGLPKPPGWDEFYRRVIAGCVAQRRARLANALVSQPATATTATAARSSAVFAGGSRPGGRSTSLQRRYCDSLFMDLYPHRSHWTPSEIAQHICNRLEINRGHNARSRESVVAGLFHDIKQSNIFDFTKYIVNISVLNALVNADDGRLLVLLCACVFACVWLQESFSLSCDSASSMQQISPVELLSVAGNLVPVALILYLKKQNYSACKAIFDTIKEMFSALATQFLSTDLDLILACALENYRGNVSDFIVKVSHLYAISRNVFNKRPSQERSVKALLLLMAKKEMDNPSFVDLTSVLAQIAGIHTEFTKHTIAHHKRSPSDGSVRSRLSNRCARRAVQRDVEESESDLLITGWVKVFPFIESPPFSSVRRRLSDDEIAIAIATQYQDMRALELHRQPEWLGASEQPQLLTGKDLQKLIDELSLIEQTTPAQRPPKPRRKRKNRGRRERPSNSMLAAASAAAASESPRAEPIRPIDALMQQMHGFMRQCSNNDWGALCPIRQLSVLLTQMVEFDRPSENSGLTRDLGDLQAQLLYFLFSPGGAVNGDSVLSMIMNQLRHYTCGRSDVGGESQSPSCYPPSPDQPCHPRIVALLLGAPSVVNKQADQMRSVIHFVGLYNRMFPERSDHSDQAFAQFNRVARIERCNDHQPHLINLSRSVTTLTENIRKFHATVRFLSSHSSQFPSVLLRLTYVISGKLKDFGYCVHDLNKARKKVCIGLSRISQRIKSAEARGNANSRHAASRSSGAQERSQERSGTRPSDRKLCLSSDCLALTFATGAVMESINASITPLRAQP